MLYIKKICWIQTDRTDWNQVIILVCTTAADTYINRTLDTLNVPWPCWRLWEKLDILWKLLSTYLSRTTLPLYLTNRVGIADIKWLLPLYMQLFMVSMSDWKLLEISAWTFTVLQLGNMKLSAQCVGVDWIRRNIWNFGCIATLTHQICCSLWQWMGCTFCLAGGTSVYNVFMQVLHYFKINKRHFNDRKIKRLSWYTR